MIGLAAILCLVQGEADCRSCHLRQVQEHTESVHARGEIGCISCHGEDEIDEMRAIEGRNPHLFRSGFTAVPENVTRFCGGCHEPEADHFKEGAHFEALSAGDSRQCLACHDYHGTRPPSFRLLGSRCLECHSKGDPHHEEVVRLRDGFETARKAAARLSSRLASTPPVPGMDQRPSREAAERVEVLLSGLAERQHAMHVELLRKDLAEAEKIGGEGVRQLESEEAAVRRRPVWLFLFLVFLVAAGGLAAYRVYGVLRSRES